MTHWQSLFSNGSRLGLETYREVVSRINSLWADKVAWRKLSEITDQFLAAECVRLEARATENTVTVTARVRVSLFVLGAVTLTQSKGATFAVGT